MFVANENDIKRPKRSQWHHSSVFNVNFQDISNIDFAFSLAHFEKDWQILLVALLLVLNVNLKKPGPRETGRKLCPGWIFLKIPNNHVYNILTLFGG